VQPSAEVSAPRPRRRSRLAIGVGILALWVIGLGLLARRELLRPMSERLADAALQVQPSSHYFLIERDGEIVGGASAEVDTSGYGIVFRQHAFGALLDEADDSVVIRTRASYTPTLRFGHFRIEFERGGEMTTMSGQRTDDSLIAVSVDSRGRTAAPETVPGPDPLFLPASAAVPVMLLEQPREGTRRRVAMFDPLSRATRTIPLSVARESVFVVVDSAGFDAETRRWRPARSDTLRAWLLLTDNSSIRAWVDRGGAPVQVEDGRGLRALRTAYEIAFENWRLERAGRARGR
jgi:hypothetical protein